jgi:hypothetical protein
MAGFAVFIGFIFSIIVFVMFCQIVIRLGKIVELLEKLTGDFGKIDPVKFKVK